MASKCLKSSSNDFEDPGNIYLSFVNLMKNIYIYTVILQNDGKRNRNSISLYLDV